MAYDARIILAGQQPDIVNVLARSTQAAGMANQQRQQNALNQLYQTQGANILAGDQGALNALAGINPMAALDVQNTRQTMDLRNRQENRLSAADKRAQQVADAERQLKQFGMSTLNAPSPQDYDRLMAENGYPQFVGTYENRQSVIAGIVDGPLAQIEEWNKAQKKNEDPAGMQTLRTRALEGGLIPGTPEYQQFMLAGDNKGPKIEIYNEQGGGSALFKKLDEKQGEMFSDMIDEGMRIPANLAMLDDLERLLTDANTPEGMEAALKSGLGEYGIQTEGLDSLQAAQALINKMVPAQRQPGSGPMSDADLDLFKQSLPRLINTRDGNLIITRTLRGIAKYQQAQADIASELANREITATDARRALRELENPLQAFREMSKKTNIGGGIDPKTQALIDKYAE